MSAHCNRLAELNRQAAATLGELAAHHTKLAAGFRRSYRPKAAAYQIRQGRACTDR